MKDSKPYLFLMGQITNFSSVRQPVTKKRSLFLYGLLVSCIFLMKTASPVWSFEMEEGAPSKKGERALHTPSDINQVNSSDSTFHPIEIAQLSPGRVEVLEGLSEDESESRLQFTENTLKQAGFILPETSPEGVILKNFGNHQTYGTGEIVYLNIGLENGVKKGGLFTIFSKVRPILHPAILGDIREGIPDYERPLAKPHPTYFTRAGKRMGHLVRPLGTLEILESTASSSKATITESYYPVKNGDFVTPFEKLPPPPILPEAKGEERLEGYVIAFRRENYISALNEIAYIDVGSNHKVIPGDRFEVFLTPRRIEQKWYEFKPNKVVPMIPHVIAELQVLDTQKETATAIVISGSDPIPLGATIRYKPVDIVSPPLLDVVALQDAPAYENVVEPEIEIPLERIEELPLADEPFADLGPVLNEEEEIDDSRQLPFSPTLELADVHFQFDKDDLDETSRQTLLANVDRLLKQANLQIQIEGHCDERGTNNYNLALGERRALAVKNFMVSHGVQENRLHLISYGEENPFCHESNESCWLQNRRVHFRATGSDLAVN